MDHGPQRRSSAPGRAIGPSLIVLLTASVASAGIHTWDVREVFSNASGTIQYVELFDAGTTGGEVNVGNGSLTSNGQTHTWANGAVATPTNGRSYLIASQSFADLPGAPDPDVIIPVGKMPFFNPASDTIAFSSGDSWTFGAVPTNGTSSLDRTSGVGANTPKNYANVQGSVNAAAAAVPTASFWVTAGLVSSLAALGIWILRRRAGLVD